VPSVLWKVAVMSGSPDGEDDPVGACVGLGGAHTRAVSTALDGAAVDFVLWQEDPRAFLRNAFPSVRIHDMVLQIRTHVATLKIQAEDKGLAIGRGGINVKVASELTGWNIKLLGGPQVSQAS
ncbi:MAG: transcription termination factor NusA, partial [Clostridia bacterium]